jgi:hypothetical protein
MSRNRVTLPAERSQLVVGTLSYKRHFEASIGGDGSQSPRELALLHEA